MISLGFSCPALGFAQTNTFPANGNVGIGKTPEVKLHVYSSSNPRIRVESSENGSPGYEFSEAGERKWIIFNNSNDKLAIRAVIGSSAIDRFVINQSGEVGIGTGSPTHRLSVNGAIRAKEIIVDTDWADYVFAPDYRLAPLAEVEQHIKEKGRLPDVPSAKEVAEKGVSVGESQAMLLRKVEELTLHLISQEKEMAKLRNEVARLSANSGPAQ